MLGKIQTTDISTYERRKHLRDDRLQLALSILDEQTPPVDCVDLAELIASREDGVDETDENAVARVAISLRYTHLPTLADWGLIDYNPETNMIEPLDEAITNEEGGEWRF